MSIARIFPFAVAVLVATSASARAQVPEDLRTAMQGRDAAFYEVDAARATTAKP